MAKIAVTNIHDRLTSAWALADADVMIQCRKCGKTEIWVYERMVSRLYAEKIRKERRFFETLD